MIVFPNCKINLGLKIAGKREDGFHNIETIFYPISLKDSLEFISQSSVTDHPLLSAGTIKMVDFTTSGLSINGDSDNNLCLKAYWLLKKDFPALPFLNIHLHKAIPMGAGLGGGSSDGAFMLKALNEKFHLALSDERLIQYALELGSDCPFFIFNKPCLGSGRGEVLIPVNLDLSAFNIVLVNPGIHINTGWAFSQLSALHNNKPRNHSNSMLNIISQPIESWRENLPNDFEVPVYGAYPGIKTIRDGFYAQGAVFASMSGSGSTLYGLFYKNVKPQFNFPPSYLVRELSL